VSQPKKDDLLVSSSFGARLQYARLLRGLSATKLEQLADISKGMVGRYERGERGGDSDEITYGTIKRLGRALNVRPPWLLDGEEPMEHGQGGGAEEDPRETARRVMLAAGAPPEVVAHVLSNPQAPAEPMPALWWISWALQTWREYAINSYAHAMARQHAPPEYATAMLSLPIPWTARPTSSEPPSTGTTPPVQSTTRERELPAPIPIRPQPAPLDLRETKPVDSKPKIR
jgi:transcriptional regulator with XRE-family HTH domain